MKINVFCFLHFYKRIAKRLKAFQIKLFVMPEQKSFPLSGWSMSCEGTVCVFWPESRVFYKSEETILPDMF